MGRAANTCERMLTNTIDNNGCLEWQKCKDKDGYGITSIQGKKMPAHRAFWFLSGRQIPEGNYLLHSCHNRCCINPNHLYVGNQKQNVQDQIDMGTFVYGSKNGGAKLTEELVKYIRESAKSHKELANEFNVSHHTIWDVRNRSWKHLK